MYWTSHVVINSYKPSIGIVRTLVTPVRLNYAKVINSGYSHISEPTLELQSRAAPSAGGNITAQSVQPQGEIPEEGRKKLLNLALNGK